VPATVIGRMFQRPQCRRYAPAQHPVGCNQRGSLASLPPLGRQAQSQSPKSFGARVFRQQQGSIVFVACSQIVKTRPFNPPGNR